MLSRTTAPPGIRAPSTVPCQRDVWLDRVFYLSATVETYSPAAIFLFTAVYRSEQEDSRRGIRLHCGRQIKHPIQPDIPLTWDRAWGPDARRGSGSAQHDEACPDQQKACSI